MQIKSIGVIRTPYIDSAPYQPVDEDKGEFRIVLDGQYTNGLWPCRFSIYLCDL